MPEPKECDATPDIDTGQRPETEFGLGMFFESAHGRPIDLFERVLGT